MNRRERLEAVNSLLLFISKHGRKFFRDEEKVSRFIFRDWVDESRHLYFQDKYGGEVYAYRTRYWSQRFSEGGTLQGLCKSFARYILDDEPLPKGCLGPYPDWVARGDPWGYGDDMEKVRDEADRLEIRRQT